MKKLIVLSLIATNFIFGQAKKIVPGIYQNGTKNSTIQLQLNTDSNYEVKVFSGGFSGNYKIENDTLIFKTKTLFSIKPIVVEGLVEPQLIKIHFKNYEILYRANDIFIGTQLDSNSKIEYKRLVDDSLFVANVEVEKEAVFSIKQAPFLYFVHSYDQNVKISKFQIPNNVTDLMVSFSPYSNDKEQDLKGYIDQSTGNLILTDGKEPMQFTNILEKNASNDYIEPISVETNPNWEKENGFKTNSTENEQSAEVPIPDYHFKHKIETDFKTAFSETAKTPNKILAISFDLKNKKRQANFYAFIKADEESTTLKMYTEYKAEYDIFNFYLATETDKSLFKKHKIKDEKGTLFLNSNGELVGFLTTIFTNPKEANIFYQNILRANQLAAFDRILNNKKASIEEVKTAFFDTKKIEMNDLIDANKDNDLISRNIQFNNEYKLKTNAVKISEKWNELIDFNSNKTEIDSIFIEIAKSELQNVGFTKKLFTNDTLNKIVPSDYKILDYYFKNQNKLNYDVDFKETISSFIYKSINSKDNNQPQTLEKLLLYYNKYCRANFKNFNLASNYLQIVKDKSKNPNDFKDFFEYYDFIYSEFFKYSNNVFENLNKLYEPENEFLGWTGFKNNFATYANNTAWAVVELDGDRTSFIKNAIKWSETSLIIEPNNHYYLDTLANLYFLNGEKDRAIAKEKEAIAIAKKENQNSDTVAEYEAVLEKMMK